MHYYKRHLGDYHKKAGHLSPLEHGIYNLIIDGYYDREQAPTLLEATRWARARTEEEKAAVLAVLDEFFTLEGERYVQSRIEDELSTYHGKAEKNREIAEDRERRKRERREAAESTTRAQGVNETSTSEARNVHETCTTGSPEQHESSTPGQPNHKPLTTNHKPRTKEQKQSASPAGDAVLFPDVDPQVVADFKALRAKKRAAITATAMRDIAKQAEKAGMTLEAALRVCCSRGWAGFEADWVLPKGGNGSAAGSMSGDKFRVSGLDHSSSNAAMAASMKKHGIVVSEDDDEIAFV